MMTKKAHKELLKSIEKWEKSDYKFDDNGKVNCELCKQYYGDDITIPTCKGCLVFKKTGVRKCGKTPYEEWIVHQKGRHGLYKVPYFIHCKECSRLKEKEAKFLRSLLKEK